MVVTRRFLIALLFVSVSAHAGSARMTLAVAPDLDADADYWPGEVGRPAVLILHGFLQTRDFPTVRRLAEALADTGYSVLLPTLTLGLDHRHQSLPCEALHTHSMDRDVAELRAWVGWLAARSGRRPVVIGHSTGAIQVSALLDGDAAFDVERAVLISLTFFGAELGPDRVAALTARARADMTIDADAFHDYALSYCTRYVTSPTRLLSYLRWDRDELRRALGHSRVPVTVIYGSRDRDVDRGWLEQLRNDGVTLLPVTGANHFFDLANEFDLLDAVVSAVDRGGHG